MIPVRLLWILAGLTVHVVGQQQVGDLVWNIYLQVLAWIVKLIAGWRLSPACRQVPLPQRVEVREQPRDHVSYFDFSL